MLFPRVYPRREGGMILAPMASGGRGQGPPTLALLPLLRRIAPLGVVLFDTALNSQLLDAQQHGAFSACAQQRKKRKTTRRKAGESITTLAQLDDREATRAREALVNRFHKTADRLKPDASAPNAANFPMENMMLMTQRENNTRTQVATEFHFSNEVSHYALFSSIMANPRFQEVQQEWLHNNGMKMVPVGDNQPAAASSPVSQSSESESEASSSATASPMADLPSLPNNGRLTFGSTSELFALADMED
eukprot:scaffold36358_cov72-Cyclotella_meneghiniana.AAC.2